MTAEDRTALCEAILASPAEAIPRIDRFLCDLKESQFGEGLHIWARGIPEAPSIHPGQNTPGVRGQSPRAPATSDPASLISERDNLTAALNGLPIPPGPSGSPWRGRADVLPTGRNLFGTDPRAVPAVPPITTSVRAPARAFRAAG